MRNSTQVLFVTILSSISLLFSCNSTPNAARDRKNENAQPISMNDSIPKGGDRDKSMRNDAETLAFLSAVDNHEIEVSRGAQKEKLSKASMDYANMMITEHSKQLEKGKLVSQAIGVTPADTEDVATFKREGGENMERLNNLDGRKFEIAYIEYMVKSHQDVLDLIDQRMRITNTEALKSLLTEARMHVAMHLEEARKIEVR